MTNLNNLKHWLEQGFAMQTEDQDDNPSFGPPTTDPGVGIGAEIGNAAPQNQADTSITNQPPDDEDVTQNPESPDMPDGISDESQDFDTWQREFFELSIKGDTNDMLDAISQVRDRNLTAANRRFIEDNLDVVLFRQDANIDKASKEIRKLISQELDRNNPAVSVMQHINNTLEAYPLLSNIFIKLAGLGSRKADYHRKFMASLTGSVIVGGGHDREDMIYTARDYSINLSTRFYTKFGDIQIGKWTLQEDDPDRYLSDSELDRLQEGSPEEKRVLRRRVVLESIASKYNTRAFLIHIVEPDNGAIHAFGWDISETLRAGYTEGKLVVRKKKSEFRDAMIDDNGAIIPLFDQDILYKHEGGGANAAGVPQMEEVSFMERRDGSIYLTADQDAIQDLSGGMPGMVYTSEAWQGNPSDIVNLMRCTPSVVEVLMRRC